MAESIAAQLAHLPDPEYRGHGQAVINQWYRELSAVFYVLSYPTARWQVVARAARLTRNERRIFDQLAAIYRLRLEERA